MFIRSKKVHELKNRKREEEIKNAGVFKNSINVFGKREKETE